MEEKTAYIIPKNKKLLTLISIIEEIPKNFPVRFLLEFLEQFMNPSLVHIWNKILDGLL